MTKKKKDEVVVVGEQVPAYIKQGEARGNENVGTDDLVIPRLILLQKISPELDKNEASYIEGAEAGQFANSLTREVYGDLIDIVLGGFGGLRGGVAQICA